MMKEFKKFEAKYLLDDILANDLTLKRIKNGEFETYEAELDYEENNHECDDYNYYEGYDEEENYQEEVEIDLHLASYIKKTISAWQSLIKKTYPYQILAQRKRRKERRKSRLDHVKRSPPLFTFTFSKSYKTFMKFFG